MSEIIGIDYSNLPPLEGKGEPSQHPFVAIRGVDLFAENGAYEDSDDGREPVEGQIQRLVLNVRPHHEISGPNLLNLDTNQLYSPVNKDVYTYGVSDLGNGGESEGLEGCPPENLSGPVYSNPAPIAGRPVEFRRVYFRGNRVDPIKGHTIDSEKKSFSAVFACSNPVEQTQYDKDGDACEPYRKNTLFNSRNENTQYEGKVWAWEDIEISPDNCPSFSIISGLNYDTDNYSTETGIEPSDSGCSTLIITGSKGIGVDLRENQVNIFYTGSGSNGSGCGTKVNFFGESKSYFYESGHSGFKNSTGDPFAYNYTGDIAYTGIGDNNCLSNDVVFLGTNGIRTFISGDYSETSESGSGSCTGYDCKTYIQIQGCPSFTKISGLGFQSSTGTDFIEAAESQCGENTLLITGHSGIHAAVSPANNSINISYTGCGNYAFTGISGMNDYAYRNTDSCNSIVFSGRNGLKSTIQNNKVIYDYTGLPNFTSSGCLGKLYNSYTNTHTYFINKISMLNCLGYYETGVNLVTWNGDATQDNTFSQTDFGDEGSAAANLRKSACIILLSKDCPQPDEIIDPGCSIPIAVGACCVDGVCHDGVPFDSCEGHYGGDNTSCSDTILNYTKTDGANYSMTRQEGCREGTSCYMKTSEFEAVCIAKETYEDFISALYVGSSDYEPEQGLGADGLTLYSKFLEGAERCNECEPYPTTSTSSTSTSSTTSWMYTTTPF